MSLHMMGAVSFADVADVAGNLLSAGGKVASVVQAKKDADKASAAEKAKLQASISADVDATEARARAVVSAIFKENSPSSKAQAEADQAAADLATSKADKVGAEVPANLVPLRVEAAEKALLAATTKLQGAPTSPSFQTLQKEWQKTLVRAQNAQITASAPEGGSPTPQPPAAAEPFLKKKIVGPVRVWHAGVAGALGLGALAVKRGILSRILG